MNVSIITLNCFYFYKTHIVYEIHRKYKMQIELGKTIDLLNPRPLPPSSGPIALTPFQFGRPNYRPFWPLLCCLGPRKAEMSDKLRNE